jgi:hypothetical protein
VLVARLLAAALRGVLQALLQLVDQRLQVCAVVLELGGTRVGLGGEDGHADPRGGESVQFSAVVQSFRDAGGIRCAGSALRWSWPIRVFAGNRRFVASRAFADDRPVGGQSRVRGRHPRVGRNRRRRFRRASPCKEKGAP